MKNLEMKGFKELRKEELQQIEGGFPLLILGIIAAWALICMLTDQQ